MEIRVIRVYEDSYDYKYENIFVVEDNEDSWRKLCEIEEDIHNLGFEEKVRKYGFESNIELVEDFIRNNFETIDCYRTDIEC